MLTIGENPECGKRMVKLDCPACHEISKAVIIVDRNKDADYECPHCHFKFHLEMDLTPLTMTMFHMYSLTALH